VATDDSLAVAAPRALQLLEPLLKKDVFARLKAAVGDAPMITAAHLATEQVSLTYDSQNLSLGLHVPVAARRVASLSLRSASGLDGETLEPARFSAFLNLRSAVDFVERGPDRGLIAPVSLLDGAVRAFGVVAEGEGYFSLRKDEPMFRRAGTRLVYDDFKHVARWTLGDVRPFARGFQAAPTVAGLSVARFYSVLEPQREIRSSGSQSFSLFAPSTVETIVNGRSVERKLLQPGTYDLRDFPLAEGANDVQLRIEDSTGKPRTIEFNLYSNRQLLGPGLSEFAGFAGVYASPGARGIAYSRKAAASGFVRRGLSQQFTAGANVQADRAAQQGGVELLFGSGLGLFGYDLAASRRSAGGAGFAVSASFEKLLPGDGEHASSLRGIVEVRSARFAVPGSLAPRESIALRASAGYALTLGRDRFIALDGQYLRDRVAAAARYSVRASGGFRLLGSLAVVGEAEWEHSRERRGAIVRLGVRRRFGERGSGQVDVDSRGVVRTAFQTAGGRGVGSWAGSVDLNRDPAATSLNAAASLLTNRAEYGVNQLATYNGHGGAISNIRTSLRAATSIAFAGGAVAIGRPIQDGFLIAAPHRSLKDARVRIDPQADSESAHSGLLGGGLEGSLSAYSHRLLVYDVPGAPPGYDLGAGNVELVPPYRAGYRLEVGSDYHLLVIGRLLDASGDPIALLAGKAIDLKAPKRPAITMFTGRTGKFGAQGLRPGRWRIEMPTEPPTIFEIDVADSPTGTVRFGDIHPLKQGRGT
jgi:outer membrane usher protein